MARIRIFVFLSKLEYTATSQNEAP